MKKINVGIVGYGNVGRGVKQALEKNADMKLVAILTRRPEQVRKEIKDVHVFHTDEPLSKSVEIDVAVLCGGSRKDMPIQGPKFAEKYNTVDSFDTHADIPRYFKKMDYIAKKHGNVSIISAGWDPGIFSLERVLGGAFLPESKRYTFWSKGVSLGHSDAARRVKGVLDAIQYTIPVEEAIQRIRAGDAPDFSKREMHKRVVYVVPEKGADLKKIRKEITEMPKYFEGYDTEVIFITEKEMKKHSTFPHGGFVFTSGVTGDGNKQILEYRCQLENNPEFTANVLVACARAAYRLNEKGYRGAFTLVDFPLRFLSPYSGEFLRKKEW